MKTVLLIVSIVNLCLSMTIEELLEESPQAVRIEITDTWHKNQDIWECENGRLTLWWDPIGYHYYYKNPPLDKTLVLSTWTVTINVRFSSVPEYLRLINNHEFVVDLHNSSGEVRFGTYKLNAGNVDNMLFVSIPRKIEKDKWYQFGLEFNENKILTLSVDTTKTSVNIGTRDTILTNKWIEFNKAFFGNLNVYRGAKLDSILNKVQDNIDNPVDPKDTVKPKDSIKVIEGDCFAGLDIREINDIKDECDGVIDVPEFRRNMIQPICDCYEASKKITSTLTNKAIRRSTPRTITSYYDLIGRKGQTRVTATAGRMHINLSKRIKKE